MVSGSRGWEDKSLLCLCNAWCIARRAPFNNDVKGRGAGIGVSDVLRESRRMDDSAQLLHEAFNGI